MGPVLIFLSILPVLLLGQYIYNKDFEKEPTGLLVSLFLMGIGSTAITLAVSYLMDSYLPFFRTENLENLNIFTLIPWCCLSRRVFKMVLCLCDWLPQ